MRMGGIYVWLVGVVSRRREGVASEWNLWVWLECIGVVIIIITFPIYTCISSFFASSIPISLFNFKMFFRS